VTAIQWHPDPQRGGSSDLAIYQTLDGRIGAAADREWFADAEAVEIGSDPDDGLLALRPAGSDDEPQLRTLSRDSEAGAEVALASHLKHAFGEEPFGGIEETIHVDLEWDDEFGAAVADLSEHLDSDDESRADEPVAVEVDVDADDIVDELGGESEVGTQDVYDPSVPDVYQPISDYPEVEQAIVGDVLAGARDFVSREVAAQFDEVNGLKVGQLFGSLQDSDAPLHIEKAGKTDENRTIWHVEPEADLVAMAPDDGDEPDRDTELLEVIENIDSVQELATALDVTEGKARARAKDEGVYTDLRDNVSRPGTDR